MSFTDLFLQYTSRMESPENFFRWSSYAAIAAVLKDNVWINLGPKTVWPNIYVIIMARSAAMRKGVPVGLAGDLVTETKVTKVIKGRTSIQAVIRELAKSETSAVDGRPQMGASGFLLTEELAAFNTKDDATIPLLTDLYDNHKEWSNDLVSSGRMVLKKTCVTLLAATNEVFFREVYTNTAIRGGLLGRTFIVREAKRKTVNSLMFEDISSYDKTPLHDMLMGISQLKGEALMEHSAKVEYDQWYNGLEKDYNQVTNDTGVLERIHTGVLKIALLLACGNRLELEVKKRDIEESIERCMALVKNYGVLGMSSGKNINAEGSAIMLTYLWDKQGKASRKDLLRNNWQHFDAKTLDEVILPTLQGAGLVMVKAEGSEMSFELTEKGKEVFRGK